MRLSPLFFSEKQVNNVFQPNGSKKLVLDCQAMAEVVFAPIIGVLNAGEWDAIGHDNLGWNVGFMFDKFTSFAQTAGGATVQLNAVQDGDLIYIANNSHYRDQDVHPTGSEKGENAIKIATDSYQSWAGPPKTIKVGSSTCTTRTTPASPRSNSLPTSRSKCRVTRQSKAHDSSSCRTLAG